jgi:hypothetical protein
MNLPNATIVVSVCEKFKPYLKLLNDNLNKSGARFELFVITDIENLEVSFMKPKKVYFCQNKGATEYLNEVILKPNNCLVLISEPFLCQENWLKNLINFKENLHNCGSVCLPFHSYIDNIVLSHALNNQFEISDVYVLKQNAYCGITCIGQEAINSIGGFNTELKFENSIVEYIERLKKIGSQNFISLEFATNLFSKKNISINDKDIQIERPIRQFSPIEEIAYHSLDDFFVKTKLQAEKFMFDFTATFGFRCMCLEQNQISKLIKFCSKYNLNFSIKSHFVTKEQRLNKNTYVIFELKG